MFQWKYRTRTSSALTRPSEMMRNRRTRTMTWRRRQSGVSCSTCLFVCCFLYFVSVLILLSKAIYCDPGQQLSNHMCSAYLFFSGWLISIVQFLLCFSSVFVPVVSYSVQCFICIYLWGKHLQLVSLYYFFILPRLNFRSQNHSFKHCFKSKFCLIFNLIGWLQFRSISNIYVWSIELFFHFIPDRERITCDQ